MAKARKNFRPSPIEIGGKARSALLYGAPKPETPPVYGDGRATDFVNRTKKLYPTQGAVNALVPK